MPRPIPLVAFALVAAAAIPLSALQVRTAAPMPTVPSVYIEELTWPEIRNAISAGRTTALIYVGSSEQNGPHMVIGKHNFIAHYVAGRIAEELGDVLVYPTLPFAIAGDVTTKTGHMRFPGTVSLSADVFEGVARQIALSAIAAGFREVYLMGDHGGGQAQLRHAAETLQDEVRGKGVRVRYVPDVYYKEQEQMGAYLTARGITVGEHAGADDTSQLMALDTGKKWIRRDELTVSDSAKSSVTGFNGDPTKATPEMGRVFLGYKVSAAVAQIRSLRSSAP